MQEPMETNVARNSVCDSPRSDPFIARWERNFESSALELFLLLQQPCFFSMAASKDLNKDLFISRKGYLKRSYRDTIDAYSFQSELSTKE